MARLQTTHAPNTRAATLRSAAVSNLCTRTFRARFTALRCALLKRAAIALDEREVLGERGRRITFFLDAIFVGILCWSCFALVCAGTEENVGQFLFVQVF